MFASVSYRRGNDALGNIILGAELKKESLLLEKKNARYHIVNTLRFGPGELYCEWGGS